MSINKHNIKSWKVRLATTLATSAMLLAIAAPAMAETQYHPELAREAEKNATNLCADLTANGTVDPAEFRDCEYETILEKLVSEAEGLDWVPLNDNGWLRQPETGLRWSPVGGWLHPQFGALSFDPSTP